MQLLQIPKYSLHLSIRQVQHPTPRMISDRSDCTSNFNARSPIKLFLTFNLGRKLADKIKKEQAVTVNSLRLELSTL